MTRRPPRARSIRLGTRGRPALLSLLLLCVAPLGTAAQGSRPDLIDAASAGDTAAVRTALLDGADLEQRDERGWTPLMHAALHGHADIADALIIAGADVNARATDGSTALMASAVMGHEAIARSLVQAGADPSLRNGSGADARFKAEQYGHESLAALLETAIPTVEAPTPPAAPAAPVPPPPKPTRRPSIELEPIGASYAVTQGANVRARPAVSSARIGTIAEGARVRVVGKVKGRTWYAVEFEGGVGYVYDRLLAPPKSAQLPPKGSS